MGRFYTIDREIEGSALDIGHFIKGIGKSPNKANASDRLQRRLIFTIGMGNFTKTL